MRFNEQERTALTDAGFVVADNNRAALVEAMVVVAPHDDETYWLTLSLPNETRIVCVMPRDQIAAALADNFILRRYGLQ